MTPPTTPTDDNDIRTWLRSTAERTPLQPLDSRGLLERGRHGRRRRRLFAGAGAVAAVAAVAVAASTLPDLGAVERTGPATTTPSPTTTSGPAARAFTPLPGVRPGEDSLGPLSRAEATRRCRLRQPGIDRDVDSRLMGDKFIRTGMKVNYDRQPGLRDEWCVVPGDSRPTAATMAAVTADPMPQRPADILRNCSAVLWHDLSAWRVVTSDRQPGVQLIVVALSPTGRHAAFCHLVPKQFSGPDGVLGQVSGTVSVDDSGPRNSLEHFGGQGSQMCGEQTTNCMGWQFYDAGRVASNVARIRVTAKNGRSHDIAVRDGWYALAWADGNPNGQPDAKITAYDAKGRRIFG